MAGTPRMAVFLVLSLLAAGAALWLESAPLRGVDGAGMSPAALLPADVLLAITAACFVAALVAPHPRLALVQAIATLGWGVGMVIAGLAAAGLGLGKLAALLALLFAFPFGTIAYFAEYGCLKNDCLDPAKLSVLIALIAKALMLLGLAAASWRFLTVKGLMITAALSGALAVAALLALALVGDNLPFLLHPLDAALTVALGVVAAIFGIYTFVLGVAALALAIAGQAG